MHIQNFFPNIIKIINSMLITGMPIITNNIFNQNSIHIPVTIKEYSTYVNYRLDNYQYNYINDYINNKKKFDNNDNLNLIKMNMNKKDIFNNNEDYYLSINIYNCTSPLFNIVTEKQVTRCEINTYVKNSKHVAGTLIIDYTSNFLSMDPVNIFKLPEETNFDIKNNIVSLNSKNKNIDFKMKYKLGDYSNRKRFYTDKNLHDLSDHIYYSNGIYDKLYYDSTLTSAKTYTPYNIEFLKFTFLGLDFIEPESIFYFYNDIKFVGGIWDNLI